MSVHNKFRPHKIGPSSYKNGLNKDSCSYFAFFESYTVLQTVCKLCCCTVCAEFLRSRDLKPSYYDLTLCYYHRHQSKYIRTEYNLTSAIFNGFSI